MTNKNCVSIWVDPDFKKKLKVAAMEEGLTLLDFTRRISKPKQDFAVVKPKNEKTTFTLPF